MTISVCIGSSCYLKGANRIVDSLQRLIDSNNLRSSVVLKGQFCTGHCREGVCVTVDGELYSVSPETVGDFFENTVKANLK